MQCPHCQTDNREDRETCYACGKDISTLRLVVNKARQHYNDALEHAERGRITEAIDELKHSIDLDSSLANAHVVLGTLYAREGKFAEARECWDNALQLQPEMARAHDYLERVDSVQAALPTLSAYRWAALLLLLAVVALAALLIYANRPDAGTAALRSANEFVEQQEYGKAMDELERARILADPDGVVRVAADAFDHALKLDLQQRVRVIQDLKYRQLYPEALEELAGLEAARPDEETSAALATIRSDISYYYRTLISQLYNDYELGNIDFRTLQSEIERFTSLYPESAERDEILGYLERAESIEVQTAMDELRRRFALDNNVQTAVEELREIAPQFEGSPAFDQARSVFIEEILSYLFNLFAGYLDQGEFVRASTLLSDIESVSGEFRDMVEVDISGAVELAYSVLADARRQHQFKQIESLIDEGDLATAEEAVWQLLLEPDLSPAEMGVLRSYWRRITRSDRQQQLEELRRNDERYFDLEITEEEASETLELFDEFKGGRSSKPRRLHLLGLAAASALKLQQDDLATSYATQLRDLDEESSITRRISRLIRERVEEKIEPTPIPAKVPNVRIEPSRPTGTENED